MRRGEGADLVGREADGADARRDREQAERGGVGAGRERDGDRHAPGGVRERVRAARDVEEAHQRRPEALGARRACLRGGL